MEQLTPAALADFLRVLDKWGVTEFTCPAFGLKRQDSGHDQQDLVNRVAPAPLKSQWEDPKLWPGGKPPVFPGAKDKV